jgi:hypothetical protein
MPFANTTEASDNRAFCIKCLTKLYPRELTNHVIA